MEVKFKVWNKKDKQMIDWFTLTQSAWNTFRWETPLSLIYDVLVARKNDFERLLFTGLKDANDTEIYTGDILREPPKNDWEETNYSCFEVFFHDGDANSDYNIGFTMNRMHNHGSVCGGYIPSFKPKSVKKMCVIGNIYENPELLGSR